jgi:hypothetical protein
LSLAAYDVDGTAYTNLITLTASNTPTLALTSTGVGTINNMSIGATTASTGAFSTLTSTGASSFATSSGDVGIGTSSPNSKLQVNSGTNLGGVLIGFNGTSANFYDADSQYWRTGNGTERARIDSSGNLIQSAPTTAPTLSTNGTMVFNLTSNTNLRVSVRGSDGVTRTADLTLA